MLSGCGRSATLRPFYVRRPLAYGVPRPAARRPGSAQGEARPGRRLSPPGCRCPHESSASPPRSDRSPLDADGPRLADDRALLRRARRRRLLGGVEEQEHRRRLLPGRPQPRLVDHRRLDLRVEHRLRARRRPRRLGRPGRRRDGALRAARLVPAAARLGVRALLHALAGLHDAGVPGAAFLAGVALRAVDRLADHVRDLEDRGRHLRRRRRVLDAAARGAAQHRRPRDRQLLDRLGPGDRAHRPLHRARWHARGGLQRRRAGLRADHRLGRAHVLRPVPARWLGRAARACAAPTCSTCGSR